MVARAWKNLSIEERADVLVNMQKHVWKKVKEEEIKAEKRRREILGLRENETVIKKEYNFELPFRLKNDDEIKARKILDDIAQKRYKNLKNIEPYHIFGPDSQDRIFWGWYDLELRWPSHYAGFIESILIIRPDSSKVKILFRKGKGEMSSRIMRKYLDEQANHIYEEIRSKLQ